MSLQLTSSHIIEVMLCSNQSVWNFLENMIPLHPSFYVTLVIMKIDIATYKHINITVEDSVIDGGANSLKANLYSGIQKYR